MGSSEHSIDIGKVISAFIVGILSVCFLLIGFYLILIRDPQTHTRWQTERAISHITMATQKQESEIAQAHVRASHSAIVQALSVSPYDPYLWIRFARIEKLLADNRAHNIDHALQIAIQLKPSLRAQIQREGLTRHE